MQLDAAGWAHLANITTVRGHGLAAAQEPVLALRLQRMPQPARVSRGAEMESDLVASEEPAAGVAQGELKAGFSLAPQT